MREHELDHTCPHCGKGQDRVSPAFNDERQAPRDGDAGLCIGCGEFLIFSSDSPGGARKPNLEEARDLAADSNCQRMHSAWRAIQRAGKGW